MATGADLEYLVRLSQTHTSFRKPELEALAELLNLPLEILDYRDDVSMLI
jgi:tRNA (guanine10-N2)-methyltransferase